MLLKVFLGCFGFTFWFLLQRKVRNGRLREWTEDWRYERL